jgi:type I restriction enzyme S subunit
MIPGYKQTEVGVIPKEWEVLPFGKIAHIERGKFTARPRNDPKYYGGDIPFIQTGDVTNANGEITTYSQTLNHAGLRVSKLFPRGTLFFTIAANIGDVGFAAFDTACPDSLVAINPNKSTDKKWLAYELARRKSSFESIATHNAQLNINLEKLRPYLLPHPPLPEQRAIAEALSDIDALLSALDRLIAKKRDLKQAAMQQLLTGLSRLPSFGPTVKFKQHAQGSIPADWDVKPFKLVSTMSGRIGWQGLKQDEFTESPDDPFLITGMNFKDGKIRWDEVYHIPEKRYLEAPPIQLRVNDILMTKDGTIGKLLYVDVIPYPEKASLNSHLLVFRPIGGQYEPRFLFYQLGSPTFAQHVELHKSGSTFYGLTQDATGKYPVILPSVSEQTAIADVLSEMDAELAELERREEKTRALKQGMMQELLTGKTRLVSPKELHA